MKNIEDEKIDSSNEADAEVGESLPHDLNTVY